MDKMGTMMGSRKLLVRGALSLLGSAASGSVRGRPRPSREQLLLLDAGAFLREHFRTHGDVLAGPVSLLQRRFDLGYGEALALAGRLEQERVWVIYRDSAGMRCAHRPGRG